MSSWCAGSAEHSGKPFNSSRNLATGTSAEASASAGRNDLYSEDAVVLVSSMCLKRAARMTCCASCTRLVCASFREACNLLHFTSTEPSLTLIFAISLRASARGPLAARFVASAFDCRSATARDTTCKASSIALLASCTAFAGSSEADNAPERSSASAAAAAGAVASSASVTSLTDSVVIKAADFLSATCCWRVFSFSMHR
mmetsp:Transcript_136216/g.250671  ORF Transcript_136216/g.250671 Transcript_136216/m.250671 type:complete len:201 (+) Transcript_136216:1222-1824(+)